MSNRSRLPFAEGWTPEFQKRLNDALEERFRVLNEYALVPYGGTQGQALVKKSDRPYELEWTTPGTGGGGGALNDLTDVTITTALTGNILRYNGTSWVNYPDSNYAPTVDPNFSGLTNVDTIQSSGDATFEYLYAVTGAQLHSAHIVNDLNLGHATDTTLARIAAGRVSLEGIEIGYRQIPLVSSTGGTAALTEVGKCYSTTGGITVPNSTFAAGDTFSIYNNSASSITITQASGLTLRLAGTATTGNRTLALRGMCTVWFVSATEAVIMGSGLT